MSDPRKRNSAAMTDGPARAPARSQLKSIGFSDEDLARPIVGVAHEWIETMPCNFNHRRMAQRVKEGVRAAGGTPMEINTISVSDGVSMGTEGMRASLVSREVITDSIEVAAIGHSFDALVVIVGCDKTIPAGAMVLARLNIPGLALYSGSIAPGKFRGQDITIQEVFEGVGAHAAGKLTADELMEIENAACPGAGACGGQFTANTMATALDFLGISPPGANVVPAMDGGKADTAFEAGRLVMDLLDRNVRPRDIITRESVENAISAVAATGGSTNAVLHLMAIAHEAGVDLELETSTASPPASPSWPTSSRGGTTSPPTYSRPAACRWWPANSSSSACSTARSATWTAAPWPTWPPPPRKPPARKSSTRAKSPSSPPAAS